MSALRTAKHLMGFLSLVLVFVFILSTEARAELYGFAAISNNSYVSGTLAEQLSLEVTDYGPSGGFNRVLFTFYNDGPSSSIYDVLSPMDSTIREVYFEDGVLLGIASILDDPPDVNFVEGASPGDLPGGNTLDPPFETTSDFLAENDGHNSTGVDPGEQVGIVYNLEDDDWGVPLTFDDVIAAINLGFTDPDPGGYTSLRIGIHVGNLGVDGEFSDSFILVPIPASVVLGMLGLGVAGLKLRKFA